MKRLLIISVLSLSLFAQTGNPTILFLTEPQTKRLNDSQVNINLLSAQLEVAKKTQENELLKIQLELGATPDKYEPLSLINDRYGFRRKAEPEKVEKPKPDPKP